MEGPDRHLDGKSDKEEPEKPQLLMSPHPVAQIVEALHREAMVRRMAVEPDDTDEHEQGAHERIDKEFESSLYPFFATPLAAKKINGDKRQLPEEVKEQGIHGQEYAHQTCLGEEHQGIKVPGLAVFVPPGGNEDNGESDGRQQTKD